MASLDVRPAKVDVLVHPGNAHALAFTWPAPLTGRTFTATLGVDALAVDVDGATVTVTFTEAQTAAVTSTTAWKLTETTSGTQDRVVGKVVPSAGGTGSQSDSLTVVEDDVSVAVTVLGGVPVAADGLWDAAGDLAVGTGPDAATRLAKGPEGSFLRAGAATVEWGSLVDADIPVTIARDSDVSDAVATHAADTTGVHGIVDTAALVTTTDPRLSDARTPTAHAATHADGGTDEVTVAQSQVTGLTAALDAKLDQATAATTYAPHVVFVPCLVEPSAMNGAWVFTPNTGVMFGGLATSPNADVAWIEWPVNLAAGTYAFCLFHTTGTIRPIYAVTVGGVALGSTIDGYAASSGQARSKVTGLVVPTVGLHVVRITNTGRNASSTANTAAISGFSLTRTGA